MVSFKKKQFSLAHIATSKLSPEHDTLLKTVLSIYLGLCWVFVSVCRLSLVVKSQAHSPSCVVRAFHCSGFPLREWALGHAGFGEHDWRAWTETELNCTRRLCSCGLQASGTGSVVVAHRPICPIAHGVLLDQGFEPGVSCILRDRFFNHWATKETGTSWFL